MMDIPAWFLLIGVLTLGMGLTAPALKRLPVTSSMLYLGVGIVIGPTLLAAFHFNPLKQSAQLELVAEMAVLLSLFTAGLKMPVPVRPARWRTPVILAVGAMGLTVGLMTAFGYYALSLPIGAAVLLAAILAPTDPVLATDVQVRHPDDRNRLRFALTCEAGMNDGTAFPFVMLGLGLLGLHDLGDYGTRWLLVDVVWATVAGTMLGAAAGTVLGRVTAWIRTRSSGAPLIDEFLGIGLIAVVYGTSLLIHAWGFLAVFAAAVALRQSERAADGRPTQPAANNVSIRRAARGTADGSLMFKEQLERLSEVALILLVGGTLFVDSWSWRAVITAFFLFLVARPLSVGLTMLGTRWPRQIRRMTAWFGVRGIGSLYYLMFAIEQGLPEEIALELIHITLIVVTLSIVVHGVSIKPALGASALVMRARRSAAQR